jgi:hypothetical protein
MGKSNYTISNDEKYDILVDLGADPATLLMCWKVMRSDDFSDLCNDLVGEFTEEGRRYDLEDWARIRNNLEGIFA